MIVLPNGEKNSHTHTMEQTKVSECRGVHRCDQNLENGGCWLPQWSQTVSPLPPPAHRRRQCGSAGIWLCSDSPAQPTLVSSKFTEPCGWGKGTREPLDPASLHKEKTPGSQLRSCGWQACLLLLYPSNHPPDHLKTASCQHGPGVGAAHAIVGAQAPVEAELGTHNQNLPSAGRQADRRRGWLSSGERGAGTGEGCALLFVSNCLCS